MRSLDQIGRWLEHLSDAMVNLTRRQKRAVLMLADGVLVALALWAAVAVRLGTLWPGYVWQRGWWLLLVLPPVGVALFRSMGLYRLLMRTLGYHGILINIQAVLMLSLILMAIA